MYVSVSCHRAWCARGACILEGKCYSAAHRLASQSIAIRLRCACAAPCRAAPCRARVDVDAAADHVGVGGEGGGDGDDRVGATGSAVAAAAADVVADAKQGECHRANTLGALLQCISCGCAAVCRGGPIATRLRFVWRS